MTRIIDKADVGAKLKKVVADQRLGINPDLKRKIYTIMNQRAVDVLVGMGFASDNRAHMVVRECWNCKAGGCGDGQHCFCNCVRGWATLVRAPACLSNKQAQRIIYKTLHSLQDRGLGRHKG